MTLENATTVVVGILTPLLTFFAGWLRQRINTERWEKEQRLKLELLRLRAEAAARGDAEGVRAAEAVKIDDPPKAGRIAIFVAMAVSGATGAGVAPAYEALRPTIEAHYCPRRCPQGEECVRGVCGKLTKPTSPLPDKPSAPEGAAVFSVTPPIYRRSPFERDRED